MTYIFLLSHLPACLLFVRFCSLHRYVHACVHLHEVRWTQGGWGWVIVSEVTAVLTEQPLPVWNGRGRSPLRQRPCGGGLQRVTGKSGALHRHSRLRHDSPHLVAEDFPPSFCDGHILYGNSTSLSFLVPTLKPL